MANEELMETLTDERNEPHFFLAGLLVLTFLVAVGLFLFFPEL